MTDPLNRATVRSPWSTTDVGSLWPVMLGGLLLAWSWWEASGSASQDDQTGWTVIAIVGVGAAALGLVSRVRAGRHAVSARRDVLVEALLAAVGGVQDSEMAAPNDAGATAVLVTYPQSRRHHRPDCLLVLGKPVTFVTATTVPADGVCEMCQS